MTRIIRKFCKHQTVAMKVGMNVVELVTFSKGVGQACVSYRIYSIYTVSRYYRNI